jgi:hypothetical protein
MLLRIEWGFHPIAQPPPQAQIGVVAPRKSRRNRISHMSGKSPAANETEAQKAKPQLC